LSDFPASDEKLIDEKLNEEMNKTREIITEALQLRAKAGIKVRQPLKALSIKYKLESQDLIDIIKDELNVKEIILDNNLSENINLSTEITEDLKLEGQAREAIRFIQEMRKEAGYEVDNRILVGVSGMEKVFEKFGEMIQKEVLGNELKKEILENSDLEKEFEIDGENIKISIKK